jgi:hypothetical protein
MKKTNFAILSLYANLHKSGCNNMKTLANPESINIIYLEADINYTTFHLIDGSKLISSFTLKRMKQKHKLKAFMNVGNTSFGCH